MAEDRKADEVSQEEATRRAKEALRRAFATPPKPHVKKPLTKGDDDKKDDGPSSKKSRRPVPWKPSS